jgi:CSLREA domain-containing protein
MKIQIPIPYLIAIMLLSIAAAAQAATITVNSAADGGGTCPGASCTLRQAILAAASGDTINFAAGITTIDQVAEIQDSTLAPNNSAEAAIIATLAPGSYTAIVQGVSATTGVGLVEVYNLQ